jgi:hypothetical protein
MTKTSELIEALVADLAPVRRLRPPVIRTGAWLLVAATVIGVLTLVFGPRADFALRLQQPAFLLGAGASILTGALAALAAFLASLPDRSRLWLALPVPAAFVWISTIGYGCLSPWIALQPDSLEFGEAIECFGTLLASSLPLSVAMFWMLRHIAALRSTGVTLVAGLAVAALTATALSLVHEFDASVMILTWNLGAAALVIVADAVIGRGVLARSFAWRIPDRPMNGITRN